MWKREVGFSLLFFWVEDVVEVYDESKKFHIWRLFRAGESWGKVYARLFSARCYLY